MSYPLFPDVDFDLAVKYREEWRTLVTRSDGEVEQRASKNTRPLRYWFVSCELAEQATEADAVKNFLSRRKGEAESFLFRTRDKRTWERVFIGQADGSKSSFCLHFIDYDSVAVRKNGVLTITGFSVVAGGPAGTRIVTFTSPPAAGQVIEVDIVRGRIVPLVRLVGVYEDDYVASDHYAFRLQVREDKDEINPFDGVES